MYVRIIMKHLFHLMKIIVDFLYNIWYNTYIVKKGDMGTLFADSNLELIWERDTAEEMTLKEVCEALGKKSKIKED